MGNTGWSTSLNIFLEDDLGTEESQIVFQNILMQFLVTNEVVIPMFPSDFSADTRPGQSRCDWQITYISCGRLSSSIQSHLNGPRLWSDKSEIPWEACLPNPHGWSLSHLLHLIIFLQNNVVDQGIKYNCWPKMSLTIQSFSRIRLGIYTRGTLLMSHYVDSALVEIIEIVGRLLTVVC